MRTIQILRCNGLTDEDPFGGNDPFVVVLCKNSKEELYRTKVKESGGTTTEWADAVSELGTRDSLTLQVWDKDVTSDDLIGAVDVQVPDVSGDARLQLKKDSGEDAGLLFVRYALPEKKEEPKEEEPKSDEAADQKTEEKPAAQEEEKKKEPKQPKPPPKTSNSSSRNNTPRNSSAKNQKRILQIKRLTGLSDEDPFSANDPFVKVLDAASKKELYRSNHKDEAGARCDFTNVFVVLGQSCTTVTLQAWDFDPVKNDIIGEVDLVVPHNNSEHNLQLMDPEGAQAGKILVSFELREEEDDSNNKSTRSNKDSKSNKSNSNPYGTAAPTPKKERNSKIPPPPGKNDKSKVTRKKLQILRCTGLADEDPIGGNDPYVVVLGGTSKSEIYRTITKDDEGSSASWADAIVKIKPAYTSVVLQVWDKDTDSDDMIGEATAEVPHQAASEVKVQLKKPDGAQAGQLIVTWTVEQVSKDQLEKENKAESPEKKKKAEPALKFKPKKDEEVWDPKPTTSFQCSERLLKPLPRGPYDTPEPTEKKDDPNSPPKKKVSGCSDRLAGTTLKEHQPLPPLSETKKKEGAEIEKHVDHLYTKSIEHKEKKLEALEKKYVGEEEPKTRSGEEIDENVTRLYTSDMERQRRSRAALEKKYLHRHEAHSKRMAREEQSASCSRLYNDQLQHVKEVNEKLDNKYLRSVQSPRRSEGQWNDTITRLSATK